MTADVQQRENTARALIRELQEKWFGSGLAAEEPHKLLRAVIALASKGRPVGLEMIERAERGDPDAEAVLCIEAAGRLIRGEALDGPLTAAAANVLLKRALSFESKRDYQNVARNIFIVHTALKLKKLGVHPTRGRDKLDSTEANHSGCSLIAEALGEKESTVQEVWEKHRWRYGVFNA